MTHDNGCTGKGARQTDDVGQLRMVQPGVEGQAHCREAGEPGTEISAFVEMWLYVGAAVADRIAGVPARRMAHSAKASAAGLDMSFEDRLDAIAQGQIGIADDPGGDAGLAVAAARAHGGEVVDELGLADRPHFLRPVGAVHRTAFEKHRRDDVVPGVDIGEELAEQIAVARALCRTIPEMMVGIDDREIAIEDRFLRLLRQPDFIRCLNASPVLRRRIGCRHASPPSRRRRRMRGMPQQSNPASRNAEVSRALRVEGEDPATADHGWRTRPS